MFLSIIILEAGGRSCQHDISEDRVLAFEVQATAKDISSRSVVLTAYINIMTLLINIKSLHQSRGIKYSGNRGTLMEIVSKVQSFEF